MKQRESRKDRQGSKGTPTAVVLAILIHAGLFLLAGMFVVFTVVKQKEVEFEPPRPVERPKMKLKKPKVKIRKSAKPKPTTRIVTKVRQADMPDIQLPEMAGMANGLSGGIGGFDIMPELGKASMFGNGQSIGNDFEGTFYNFNYDRNGRRIPMDSETFFQAVHRFISSGWDVSKLAKYYHSPNKLYATHFMIPHIPAPMAPDVFGESGMEGFNYALLYKGELVSHEPVTFRFRGSGDSFIFVRVDGKIVLLASWERDNSFGLGDLWHSSSADNRKFFLAGQLASVGDWITREPDTPRKMEVFFGEGRGGFTGVALVVEVKGVEYDQRGWQGSNPIFPAFKTEEFSQQDVIDDIYFHLPEGEVSLTNGPVFRDYGPGVAESAAAGKQEAPPPATRPEEKKTADEIRTWSMANGRTFEAKFTNRFGSKATFKGTNGKTFKVPFDRISEEDRKYIELEVPPTLGFSFSKQTSQRQFPSAINGEIDHTYLLPTSFYYNFGVDIKQTSPNAYNHELFAELFVIGSSIDGSEHILLQRLGDRFMLTDENHRTFHLAGKPVELSKILVGFVESGRQVRGRKYSSFLVVVTDSRGKIIAYKTPKKWLFGILDQLRSLPVGSYFDKEGNRVRPSRPQPYFYHF